ncbi:hypothetical protein BDR03DRAFT_145580 [Suillus americanus]|nr:hypothetical protein BDR03DRAFT_145580 [Suillus americanus]
MKLSLGDTFSLHVRYKRWYRTEHEDIVSEPEDIFCLCGARERQSEVTVIASCPWLFNLTCTEYNHVHTNITIVVELSRYPTTEQLVSSSDKTLELRPTTDEICRKCPQFRILVIGKTGVRMSSLINYAFGVQNATSSHDKPGEASIDHEFISPQNDGLFSTIAKVLNRRKRTTSIKSEISLTVGEQLDA